MGLLLAFISGCLLGGLFIYLMKTNPFEVNINITHKNEPVPKAPMINMSDYMKNDSKAPAEDQVLKDMRSMMQDINEALDYGGKNE